MSVRELRKKAERPCLCSPRAADANRSHRRLELGADDYCPSPSSPGAPRTPSAILTKRAPGNRPTSMYSHFGRLDPRWLGRAGPSRRRSLRADRLINSIFYCWALAEMPAASYRVTHSGQS